MIIYLLMLTIKKYNSMRILIINKFLFPNGGAESYIFKLGKYLENVGHEVQYFGMEHEGRCVGNSVNSYTSDMDFHKGSIFSKILYPIKTIYSAEARKKLRLVLESFSPDVCHINNFNYQLTPSILLEIKKWKNEGHFCRIVYTAHDYQLVCPNHMCKNPITGSICEKCFGGKYIECAKNKCIHSSFFKSLIATAESYLWNSIGIYKHFDRIICCSKFLKKKLDTNKILSTKTVVMHNFVEPSINFNTNKKEYILYFGRYSKEKGIETLINVAKELPHISFIFAGGGPLESEIDKVINIKNVGFKSSNELEKLIREALFSVYPSEWYENCPLSVMESQILGTPVLGAKIGGIPELIENGKTGILFDSGNLSDLKDCIINLWNNPKLVDEYSKNCKNVSFDDLGSYVKKLMDIYKG